VDIQDAPAPPPPEKPLVERAVEATARVVRPYLPASLSNVNDKQAIALGALGIGCAVTALALCWGTVVLVRRGAGSLRQRRVRARTRKKKRSPLDQLREAMSAPAEDGASLHEIL